MPDEVLINARLILILVRALFIRGNLIECYLDVMQMQSLPDIVFLSVLWTLRNDGTTNS